jgi:hypothetical protein
MVLGSPSSTAAKCQNFRAISEQSRNLGQAPPDAKQGP